MVKEKLWIRKLSCGHERPTNISFMVGNYKKPNKENGCFCRQCNENVDILDVYESNKEDKKELKQLIKKEKQNSKSSQ